MTLRFFSFTQRLDRVEISPSPSRLLSAVTNVSFNNCAVAAKKWSAGSLCGSTSCRASKAISWVNGASRNGDVALLTQSAKSAGKRILPFALSVSASHVLMGESHVSFCGFLSSCRTLFPSFAGSFKLHNQMCVSRRSFNRGEPPTHFHPWPEKRYRLEFSSSPSSSRSNFQLRR